MINEAYERTKQLIVDKRSEVETIAEELLDKEILFRADLERLIGKRPFEDKYHHPANLVEESDEGTTTESDSTKESEEVKEEE